MEHLLSEFSNKVADALDQGFIPWRLPCLSRNILNGKVYGGVNPILLNLHALRFGYQSPYWGTFVQWQTVSAKVKQPDIPGWGARILLYKPLSRSTMELRLVRECVYNMEQTDGKYRPPVLVECDPGPVFEGIIKNAGIRMDYHAGADCRWISGPNERIHMPHKWMFENGPGKVEAYYDTLGHEIFHWTEDRMGWKAHYDINELRAEIGTGYLGAALGVKPMPRRLAQHHDRYASTWANILRQNPQVLFDVCENVTATVTSLLRLVGGKVAWQANIEGEHDARRIRPVEGIH